MPMGFEVIVGNLERVWQRSGLGVTRMKSSLIWAGIAFWLLGISAGAAANYPIQLMQDPSVSPDGKTIAFSWRGDIWTVGRAGGAARQLTTHPAADRAPEFSPDGKRIAFVSSRTGSAQVFVIALAGGEPVQWTFHSEGYDLQGWYPDGRSLLVQGRRDHYWRHSERFMKIPAKPRAGEKVLFDGYGDDGHLSADGKRLLFSREGTRYWRKGYRGSQASQVWMYDFEGGTFHEVAEHESGCRYPLWHPSGKSFYYVTGKSGSFNLWLRNCESRSK